MIYRNGVNVAVVENVENEVVEEREQERALDICPYCGQKMRLTIEEIARYQNRGYSKVYYRCQFCGSSGVPVNLHEKLLSEEAVQNAIREQIEGVQNDIRQWDEEEGFEDE